METPLRVTPCVQCAPAHVMAAAEDVPRAERAVDELFVHVPAAVGALARDRRESGRVVLDRDGKSAHRPLPDGEDSRAALVALAERIPRPVLDPQRPQASASRRITASVDTACSARISSSATTAAGMGAGMLVPPCADGRRCGPPRHVLTGDDSC
jgi:hypothetical protein